MLFLHVVMPSKRMMDTYFRMIREHFVLEEHRFLFIDQCMESERELFDYGNVAELSGETSREKLSSLCQECDAADVIIWHGLMYGGKKMLPLFVFRRLRKKSVWIMRGLDLYNWKSTGGVRYKFINFINRYIRKHIPFVVAILPTDEKVYRKQFGKKAKCKCVFYPFSKEAFQEMDSFENSSKRPNGNTFIMVGNNAYTFNRHIMALEKIRKFSNEDIKLFIPLSYGNNWYNSDDGYEDSIIKYLEENFDEKGYEVLEKLIEPKQYNKILMNMDIALMPSNRQNALGNILRLLYVGNKVYLANDNPMYQWFLEQGVEVFDIADIENMAYQEFIQLPSGNNTEWVRKYFHPDNNYKEWGELFEEIVQNICGKRDYICKSHQIQETDKKYGLVNRKVNYLCIKRAQYLKPGSRLKDLMDVYVVGNDEFEYDVTSWLEEDNQIIDKWCIQGIIDQKDNCKRIEYIKEDIVGNIEDFYPDDEKVIIAIENNKQRREVYDLLKTRNCSFSKFIHPTTSVCLNPNISEGCIIYPNAIISSSVEIGIFTYVKNSVIGQHCKIGQFCNIGSYSILGEGVTIGNNVIIGKNVVIGDNVTIGDNVNIIDNMVLEEGKVIAE